MSKWEELLRTPLREKRSPTEEDKKIRKFVEVGVKIYNRYRSPESTARFLRQWNNIVAVLFEGSFCTTCGVNDWIEDLKYILEDLGANVELLEIIEPNNEYKDSRIGIFKVEKLPQKIVDEPGENTLLT